jgi:hypothetical protein
MSDKYLIVQDIMQILIGENDSAIIEHGSSDINEKIKLDCDISKYVLLLDNPVDKDKERIMRKLTLSIDRQKQLNQAFALRRCTKKLAEDDLKFMTDFNKDFEEFEVIDDTVSVCIQSVVKETSHRIYSLWKQYFENELFRSTHMKDLECYVSCYPCTESVWETMIKESANEIKKQMVESLRAMGIKMSAMTKDQIITSPDYRNLFPAKLIKKTEYKIKMHAAGKRKKPDHP